MSSPSSQPASLHRYTSLQNVAQMLKTRSLNLRDPWLWEDQNDSYSLEIYKSRTKAKALFAICFTQAPETYHHWKVFADRGACVEFSKEKLLEASGKVKGLRAGAVQYREIGKLAASPPEIRQLPFLKRFPYRDEQEFRMIYTAQDKEISGISFPIPLESIRRITLSPWLSDEEIETEKAHMKKIDGCKAIKVYRTTVLNNKDWKAALRASHF